MNWEQLKAILWLRWRLTINQWRRGGALNFALMMILFCSTATIAVLSFFMAIGLGILFLPKASPATVMVTWDIMIGVLLFSWSISILVEIQRTELLSIEKLLHLPLSLKNAFLLNYLSSLICLNIACFFPASIGLCIALAITNGPKMLLMVPMVLSFILMLTAVTYQFRGWLASLMSNKRRQRTVITVVTFGFILIAQVPNIVIQLSIPESNKTAQRSASEQATVTQELSDSLNRQEISREEYDQRLAEITKDFAKRKADAQQASQAKTEKYLTLTNQVLPVGWLPYASKTLLDGSLWPSALCLLGMTMIGSASLWRAYSATMNHYTGNVKAPVSRKVQTNNAIAQAVISAKPQFMERSVPLLSEASAAIAVCNLRNLQRAPEAKMLLIGPVIISIMFVLMILSNRTPKIPAGIEPLIWLGGVAVLTFMYLMLILNMFGMDRSGFRSFILMPVERSEILVGKNVSIVPIICGLAFFFAVGLYYLAPIGVFALIACVSQMAVAFIVASMIGNWVSIQFPIAMITSTGKPVQVNFVTMLVQMVVVFTIPLSVMPGALFFGIEWSLKHFFSIGYLPVFALLSIAEAWLALKLYHYVIPRQGSLLQKRETRILEVLTANSE